MFGMTPTFNNVAAKCTFEWKIENINLCWLKKEDQVESPAFIADILEETKWSLQLCLTSDDPRYNALDLKLHREKEKRGPKVITVKYQLAILGKDGSFLKKKSVPECKFEKDQICGYSLSVDKVFLNESEVFIPENILTVQCTIWYKIGEPARCKHFYARTIYQEERGCFEFKIENFSSLTSSPKKIFKHDFIKFNIFMNKTSPTCKELFISIDSMDEGLRYFLIKTFRIPEQGEKQDWEEHGYVVDDLKRGVLSLGQFYNTIYHKATSSTNDVLSLECEYIIGNKIALFEFSPSENIPLKLRNQDGGSRNESYINKENSPNTTMLQNDLKFMLKDALFSDMEIRTLSRNFPAHKSILSARSPVFRNMFSHDMKENNSGHIDIIDFDDDTVHRMLLFIYTDSLDDLQFESASMLYRIADKYQIMSLKISCSSFLKENFNPTNVCNVLLLADKHHDEDLKSFAQNYILVKGKEIFCSLEWKNFMDNNLKLAADIMYQKIYEE